MKRTRKQKLQRRQERKHEAEDRKFAIVKRVVDLLGVADLVYPLPDALKEEFMRAVNPQIVVEASPESTDDPIVEIVRRDHERIVRDPVTISLEDRDVDFALGDFYRAYHPVVEIFRLIFSLAGGKTSGVVDGVRARFNQAMEKVDEFERDQMLEVLATLVFPLIQSVEEHLRIDEQIVWYRIEPNLAYPNRAAFRIVLGKKTPVAVSLPLPEGRRTAYPCERSRGPNGLRQLTWNPARLGIGSHDQDIPVFVSKHAIERLHERMPVAPYLSALHRMMCDAIEDPRLHPRPDLGDYLVEAGPPGAKTGYFVAKIYADKVFISTFLFLTMQGTPEADCLRRRLGLSRRDIEYYKLDNFFTLTISDLGQDPELRNALAKCNCAHLLDLFRPEERLAWLDRYRNPFRKDLGLPFLGQADQPHLPVQSTEDEIKVITDESQRFLKMMQGWTIE